MIRKPKMILEVLEAIEDYFDDDPEIAVDCLLYLSGYLEDKDGASRARYALEQMGRCKNCGTPLDVATWDVHHTELEGSPIERMSEVFCPECDVP